MQREMECSIQRGRHCMQRARTEKTMRRAAKKKSVRLDFVKAVAAAIPLRKSHAFMVRFKPRNYATLL